MIKLELESYCHNGCRAFEADVVEPAKFYEAVRISDIPLNDTVIRCTHRNLCKQLLRYLTISNTPDEGSENHAD